MFSPRLVLTGTLLVAAGFFAGCAGSPMSRIDSNRSLYESWPIEVQEAVLEGRVIKDMTKEQVQMAVGKPSEMTSRNSRQGLEEVWVFQSRSGPSLGGTSVSIGGSVGGVGVGGTPIGGGGGGGGGDYNEVVFVDGLVVRSTFPQ